ncbi:amidase [Siccirubricoccus phaeus]|uniref:amidase n=1 Tax=Siccirubricoccus phaeus TaxID=2595053 RepID=UPI0011F1A5D7|nr:amidase [Siccirubricoccus phaeus]
MAEAYNPTEFRALTWHDHLAAFRDGTDTPRAYLERCLATIAAREPVVQAWATMNIDGARAAADASSGRWQAGTPLSAIDGLPIGIKDLLETRDMPTEMGCRGYKGHFPKRDNAAVWALRQAGAVVLGKTVTTELGGSHPGPTTNPFNPRHTPGGSSSGSAAAVAARMVPAAIGTQVGGSIIRPAAFCGNVALKPSQGGLHRGERQTTSMSTHGVHAGSIEDMWQVAIEIAARCGGDPGRPGLQGPRTPPASQRPVRLIVMESEGWAGLDAASKSAFEALLARIADAGVELLRRGDHPAIEAFEQGIAEGRALSTAITGWENRWYQRALLDADPEAISPRARGLLERAEAMSPRDYQAALAKREEAQLRHARLAGLADAIISLACPGPAPVWEGDKPGQPLAPRPTGDAVFNIPSSLLWAPVVTVPLLAVGGLPVGVQVMGQYQQDARVTALARWLLENIPPLAA